MIRLKKIQKSDLIVIYNLGFTQEFPFWASMNAPYFNEYKQVTYEAFLKEYRSFFIRDEFILGIYKDESIIGSVSAYWENKDTLWMSLGIAIYDDQMYGKGYGKKALSLWIDECFKTYPQLEHLGLTTWSGNAGMMKTAESLGMKMEARIRKVRYYQDLYYDSITYGVLRQEWNLAV